MSIPTINSLAWPTLAGSLVIREKSLFIFSWVKSLISFTSYIVYGPLLNGVSTTVFESTPVYPTPSRYWQTVEKHKLTQFYSAPTAIRLLRRLGHHHVEPHDLSTLRVLGSVGEPINPEAWNWYNEHVGRKQCSIVDTYWQTETGSIIVTPFPGAVETKPGSATVPFFGIEPVILDPTTGKELEGNNVEGVLAVKKPWPSLARSVYQDHNRYLETYMKPYPGVFYTGDGAARDEHGYIWIKGRIDDVINVSGHRLSTAEIESALILHKGVAETAGTYLSSRTNLYRIFTTYAVIGTADELTGQAVYAFVTLKPYVFDSYDLCVYPVLTPFLVLVNSNTTSITRMLSPRNSSFRSAKSSGPSQHPRRSSLSAICPRLALVRSCVASCARSSPVKVISSVI